MAFEAGSIIARMKLDRKQFSAGLQSAVAETRQFNKIAGGLMASGAFVTGLTLATKKVLELAEAGAQLRELEETFRRVAAAARTTDGSIIGGVRLSTFALSNREIMQFANQLALLGVSADKLPRLAAIAEAVADATGRSTREVLDALITGTARASDRMLRMLGINVELTKGLSDEAQQAEFLNQILDRGATIIEKYGNEAVTAADSMDRARTATANWSDELKKAVSGPVAGYIKAMQSLRDMGFPTKPSDMLGIVRWLDKAQDKGNRLFPGIFAPATGSTAPRLSTPGNDAFPTMSGGPRMSPVALEALRAQQAARAYFQSITGPARAMAAAPATARRGGVNSFLGLDWGEVSGPALSFGEPIVNEFNMIGDALGSLGDSFAGFFEMLVIKSDDAGRAFFSGLMGGFSQIASNLGDLYIQAGIGMMGLITLSPLMSIAAGFALKAIGGVLRGISFNNAPHSSPVGRSVRAPLDDEISQGAMTIVVNGDYIGDRVWVDRLIDKVRQAQRYRGAPSPVVRFS